VVGRKIGLERVKGNLNKERGIDTKLINRQG
jgi:hypothetical protein